MTRVVAVQISPTVGELEANLAMITDAVSEVLSSGAELIVLPELATSGYVFDSLDEARSLAIPREHPVFAEWASRLGQAVAVVGFAESGNPGPRLHNSAAVIDQTGVRAVYRKVHLWDREKMFFEPGDAEPPIVETPHGRVGVMVCFDLEFPEWARIAALKGADLLAVPTNWPLVPVPSGDVAPEIQIALATARMNHMAIAFADRVGTERDVEWTGGTGIVGADGHLIESVGPRIGSAWADIDLPSSRNKRQTEFVDLLGDRRPELYSRLLDLS